MTVPSADLASLKNEALRRLAAVADLTALEAWRVTYLGRKGSVSTVLRGLKDLPVAERKLQGQPANQLRQELEQAFAERRQKLAPTAAATIDVTVPGRPPDIGHLHPLSQAIRRITDIFVSMGFLVVEGPLVEEVRYNFDLLNIPLHHPSRSEVDTFYLTNGQILRTQTSPMQIRAVLENNLTPPFRILAPGMVFRAERTDASHETTFHQFEGLLVAEHISVANFRAIIESFFTSFFGQAVALRLRPAYFPFVEPGMEVDISCVLCGQAGCRVCKYTGWLEVMGAGSVHPQVLMNMNIDPVSWQGFAFGGAVDRLAMLKHRIDDIRLFWSGDLRFLQQF